MSFKFYYPWAVRAQMRRVVYYPIRARKAAGLSRVAGAQGYGALLLALYKIESRPLGPPFGSMDLATFLDLDPGIQYRYQTIMTPAFFESIGYEPPVASRLYTYLVYRKPEILSQ